MMSGYKNTIIIMTIIIVKNMTYAWGWYRWWLKKADFNVLCISLNTTWCLFSNNLWVGINIETSTYHFSTIL